MAATKTKNGKIADEVAAKAVKDAKAMADSMMDAANKAVEDSKPLISAQQELMKDSFVMWQDISKTYFDFFGIIGDSQPFRSAGFTPGTAPLKEKSVGL